MVWICGSNSWIRLSKVHLNIETLRVLIHWRLVPYTSSQIFIRRQHSSILHQATSTLWRRALPLSDQLRKELFLIDKCKGKQNLAFHSLWDNIKLKWLLFQKRNVWLQHAFCRRFSKSVRQLIQLVWDVVEKRFPWYHCNTWHVTMFQTKFKV